METKTLSPGKFGVNYGIMLGLLIVVISVIMYVTGLSLEGAQWPMWVYYLIFAATIFYAISQYKKQNGNLLKLGEAIKTGLAIAAISALIFVVYNLIFSYIIDPGYNEQVMDVVRDKMMENPNMTEEMVEQNMMGVEIFSHPLVLSGFWIAMSLFMGLIYSLIGGLIMKKEVPQY